MALIASLIVYLSVIDRISQKKRNPIKKCFILISTAIVFVVEDMEEAAGSRDAVQFEKDDIEFA